MDWVIGIISGKYVEAIATLSSVISLVITIAVYFGIRKIKRFYAFTARVPELNERLGEIASKISSSLNSGTLNIIYTKEMLADAEVILKSIYKKVDQPLKKQVKKILHEIESIDDTRGITNKIINFFKETSEINSEGVQESRLREVYISLYKLNAECKNAYEDSRWEQ